MTFHLLHLHATSIFAQLQIEEALLRADTRNWCLINEGTTPSIVMGISGKPQELIDLNKTAQSNIPVIRRFSGGGTVVVDENTLFVTFICQKQLHSFPVFPEPILKWSEEFYRSFLPIDSFHLRENDFVIGDKKCAGNAQYIKKDRWLLHTSFLWDYHHHWMELLLHPKKTPTYRKERQHADFLCRLKNFLPTQSYFLSLLKQELCKCYEVVEMNIDALADSQSMEYRKQTSYV